MCAAWAGWGVWGGLKGLTCDGSASLQPGPNPRDFEGQHCYCADDLCPVPPESVGPTSGGQM